MTVPVRSAGDGGYTTLNITSNAQLLTGRGMVARVIVTASAATASTINDSATTATASNTVLTIPASTPVGTIYILNWPLFLGLLVAPGAGNALSISWGQGNEG